ncbi:MAG: hypothetical protein V7L22_30035 [Nostoc sp.]|uniref:hypothetical protein n=1 Tax=Nostoc sp. TaxID=1180 RepID=UPI002FFD3DC0
MTLLTLRQVFGANVVETSTTITIFKSDLLGLTPATSNTADSIFAAIINTAHEVFEGNLTDENALNVIDENSITITYDNHLYYSNTWVLFWGYLLPSNSHRLNTVFIFSEIEPYED